MKAENGATRLICCAEGGRAGGGARLVIWFWATNNG